MADKRTLSVRMYCMGVGDCFLLRFGVGEGGKTPFHLLIDCGMYQNSPAIDERLTAVLEDIREVTGGTIDLLLITHEHYDHLAGFISKHEAARRIWNEPRERGGIAVERVWMGWTEGLSDEAKDLRQARADAAKMLKELLQQEALREATVVTALDDDDEFVATPPRTLYEALTDVLGFDGPLGATGDAGLSFPAEAMAFVKRLVRAPEYKEPPKKGAPQRPIIIDALPGVRFYILGPPRSPELFKSEPRKNEAYGLDRSPSLAHAFYAAANVGDRSRLDLTDYPFNREVGIPIRLTDRGGVDLSALPAPLDMWQQDALSFFEAEYLGRGKAKSSANTKWRRIDSDWLNHVSELALDLDADTNNTSLAIAIELIGVNKAGNASDPLGASEVLIFPGDAQAGNWRSWGDPQWVLIDQAGREQIITVEHLLRKTVFYKVGHHGSHNATLRRPGLEQMGQDSARLIAMIPTDEEFARRKRWKMPFAPLYKELLVKTGGRVIRGDYGCPTFVDGALDLPEMVRKSLNLGEQKLGQALEHFNEPNQLDWARFAGTVKTGPTLKIAMDGETGEDPVEFTLYYELDLVE